MKNIDRKAKKYLEEFDIHVRPYLHYEEIQGIVNTLKKFETWAERQLNIDMLILYYITDINKDKIQELGHEYFLETGIIDAVYKEINNLDQLNEAIKYTESIEKSLIQIIKYFDVILKKEKTNGSSSKK